MDKKRYTNSKIKILNTIVMLYAKNKLNLQLFVELAKDYYGQK
jgi:hypothetical protein